ncbi:transmembrane protein 70 homolog, mitochondrial [Bombus pyrosoma]|uniref:transmembrane protein 70 homolog, mitochondrial n=1 Tax=Bombus pyrosoma TaxID=396416 RepID=UPI001CB98574|nr:transmembrane protein 70 homolog, mitochondrial [Bombus pyrosoma]XP_043583993.1 transmembrane protein 70 homolog, mitochondrial [Bombus pyrosoma]
MVLLLRSCILNQRKLFMKEIIVFKRTSMYYTCGNVEKFRPCLQVRHVSDKHSERNTSEREMIYNGTLTNKVRNIKMISLLSSAVSLISQPIIYMKILEEDNLVGVGTLFALLNVITISSPLLIHLLTRRYVIEMYHYPNEEKYTAKLYSFFCKEREITFSPNDVIEPKTQITGAFTTCVVGGKPLLLDENNFIDPKHYKIIMNYNKPIDFEVEQLHITAINRPQDKRITMGNKNEEQK